MNKAISIIKPIILILLISFVAIFIFTRFDLKKTNDKTSVDTSTKPQTVIEKVIENKAGQIDLSNLGLIAVPDEILNNKGVAILNLSNNSITSLPSRVENWTKMESFNIANNKLNSLVGEIRRWQKLKSLDASGNGMTGLPAEIGQLPNLRILNLADNNLTELPNELQNLTGLVTLDLRGNPIKADHIQKLKDALINTNILY